MYITLETVATGLTAPNWGTTAPGQPNRLFVTDQAASSGRSTSPTAPRASSSTSRSRLVPLGVFGPGTYDERGFLGVAFHPDYATNGLLYTFTSEPRQRRRRLLDHAAGDDARRPERHHRMARAEPDRSALGRRPAERAASCCASTSRSSTTTAARHLRPRRPALHLASATAAAPTTRTASHSSAARSSATARTATARTSATVLGKILRIDPAGQQLRQRQVRHPGRQPVRRHGRRVGEIFAYGFRNPFRFSFDPATGDLLRRRRRPERRRGGRHRRHAAATTAGASRKAASSSTPTAPSAGFVSQDLTPACRAGLIDPVAAVRPRRGPRGDRRLRLPRHARAALAGHYVFGDFARTFGPTGRLFHLESGQVKEFPIIGMPALNLAVMGFGQDANGEIYLLANSTATPFGDTGVVLRIAPPPPPGPPLAVGGITSLVAGSDGTDASASASSGTANWLYAALAGSMLAISAAGYLTTKARRHIRQASATAPSLTSLATSTRRRPTGRSRRDAPQR